VAWPDQHPTVEATDLGAWRGWLHEHHATARAAWLLYWKKGSGRPSITWSEAVDEALCFGWIDSTIQPLDEARYVQYFTRRKPTSEWSRVNKDKVARLIDQGRMTEAGLHVIERAKANGSWTALDLVEDLVVPADLLAALAADPLAAAGYDALSVTLRKQVLRRVYGAKRPQTRAERIAAIVGRLAAGLPPVA